MNNKCFCDPGVRQWDELSGRCLTCNCYYVRLPLPGEHTLTAVARAVGIIPPEQLTSENLTAEYYLKKTWSVVADKMGSHWHATVRSGQEGSRALLGKLQFDLSDVEDLRDRLHDVADRIANDTVDIAINELTRREAFRYGINELYRAELRSIINGLARKEARVRLLERLVWTFGVRVDLAKVNG